MIPNAEVKVRPNEKIETACARFKRKVIRSGILNEIRGHECFMTKSEKKRFKKRANRRQ